MPSQQTVEAVTVMLDNFKAVQGPRAAAALDLILAFSTLVSSIESANNQDHDMVSLWAVNTLTVAIRRLRVVGEFTNEQMVEIGRMHAAINGKL